MSKPEHPGSEEIRTKGDVFGGPKDWVLALALLVVLPATGLWASVTFPLVDPLDPVSLVVGGGLALFAFELMRRRRRSFFPWWNSAPFLAGGSLIAMALLTGFLAIACFNVVNGALDRSAPIEVRLAVVRKAAFRDKFRVRVAPPDTGMPAPWRVRGLDHLDLSEPDYERVRPGAILVARVGRGFLRSPWYRGYRLTGEVAQ